MKILAIFVCILLASALEFETFQEALDFDPDSLAAPNCKNDDEFTSIYEAFLPWIQVIEEGEIEMQEDHSVLTQAKNNIVEAREYIVGLDEDIDQEQQSLQQEQTEPQQEKQQQTENQVQEPQQEDPAPQQVNEQEDDDEDDDQFGWGEGEVPQMLVHSKSTKAGAFVQLLNGNTSLKFKNKIQKLIAMASKIESVEERRQRKIELCDQIIDEITNMLLFLEKIMNDIDFQVEALDIFRKKQEQVQQIAVNCGARVISYQDASLIEVPKHEIKQKRRANVSFLQIAMDDEDVQRHQLEYQKQVLLNQGMLGFLRNSGKQVKLIH